jgi:predicted CopG family antitoxin
MGHRTLTISDEAYRILSSLKREKESFTDVIKRVFGEPRKRPLAAFTGAWQGSDEELNRILGDIDDLWKTYDAELRQGEWSA